MTNPYYSGSHFTPRNHNPTPNRLRWWCNQLKPGERAPLSALLDQYELVYDATQQQHVPLRLLGLCGFVITPGLNLIYRDRAMWTHRLRIAHAYPLNYEYTQRPEIGPSDDPADLLYVAGWTRQSIISLERFIHPSKRSERFHATRWKPPMLRPGAYQPVRKLSELSDPLRYVNRLLGERIYLTPRARGGWRPPTYLTGA